MNRAAEPYLKLDQIVNAFAASRVLQVASALDLFTAVANQGKTAAQLASHLDLRPEALELLLNALTAMGLLRKEAERFFDTPIAHTYLSRSGPKYLGHLIRHEASGWSHWEHLLDSLRAGRPVRPLEHLDTTPGALKDFIYGMHELAVARGDARWLARFVSLSRCRTLLDLGGGPGTYAAHFCRQNPQLRATVVDLPATLDIARRILRDFDLTGRVALQAADYRRDPIPGGPYDAALLSNILHAEDESTNRQLLQRVHAALVPGALLMIKDHIMNAARTEPLNGALFALEMLLTTRGRTYSRAEVSTWLEAAGFRDVTEVAMEPPANGTLLMALRPGKRVLVSMPKLPVAPLPLAEPATAPARTAPAVATLLRRPPPTPNTRTALAGGPVQLAVPPTRKRPTSARRTRERAAPTRKRPRPVPGSRRARGSR